MSAWTPDAITALLGAITALLGAITALGAVALKALNANTKTTNETHQLVNNLHDEDTVWRETMEATLRAHNIAMPPNPGTAAAAARIETARHKDDDSPGQKA
jgi:hypothetical protein